VVTFNGYLDTLQRKTLEKEIINVIKYLKKGGE
jgi:hypothetical protein